ncbi:MAG: MFS transporter [Sphingobacteriales bacterium]|nr:MFS transporter [Sphingobacteriales bacterium]MCC7222263.1 MFS transporter [Chitinophagales bacterium]
MTTHTPQSSSRVLHAAVIVAALGYFVDIYDLVLFSVTRVQSLTDIGVPPEQIADIGSELLGYWQMLGMLVGGILWGVWGDKKGRLSVLFGSILMYSVANIANAFVSSVEQYKILRLIAGIGLAGELGAGVTLVSEVLDRHNRGYGTTIIATIGVLGAVAAFGITALFDHVAAIGQHTYFTGWRMAYLVGGLMGFALLILRISVHESGMFKQTAEQTKVERGNFIALVSRRRWLYKYILCILIGLPTWYVVGILVTLTPEFAKNAFMMTEAPKTAGMAVMWCYLGLALGDLLSGLLSQWWRSRKKVMWLFHLLSLGTVIFYLTSGNISPAMLYTKSFLLGIGVGYWAVFVTIASEQFGTNIRATVATTVPNFARGSLAPITFIFASLKTSLGLMQAALILGAICIGIALFALMLIPETFGKELDYIEE